MAGPPAPLGTSTNSPVIDAGTAALVCHAPPGPICGYADQKSVESQPIDADTRLLAALAYGESSTQNFYEEMAAIANVIVRQQKARGYTSITAFVKKDKTFSYAAYDGNARYGILMKATDASILADLGMSLALKAAENALSNLGTDYSNGAYFWDGADIKSNYDNHPKVRSGIHFSDKSHNIYNIDEKQVPGEEWWRDAQGKNTKIRGKWNYKYESTAAYGGTVFWKYNDDFLKATGNRKYD